MIQLVILGGEGGEVGMEASFDTLRRGLGS